MSKKLLLSALLLPYVAGAAILPEGIGGYRRTVALQPPSADESLWEEYGLKSTESAIYQNGPAQFTVTIWQLQDTTGAMAAFQWQRPPQSKPSAAASLAAEAPSSLLLVEGNYLISFRGEKPHKPEIEALTQSLKNIDATPLPVLPSYLPSDGLIPNSERYVLGPVGLARFDGSIPPSAAAFHFGAEAQLGVFRTPKGNMTVAIFNYPTPQIAMQQATEMGKLPGAVVKRSGPLLAVTLAPPDPDRAEFILSKVRYRATVTRDEYVPTRRDNLGDLILNILILIGILVALSVLAGIVAGGLRMLRRRGKSEEELEPMITLHLEKR